MAGVESSAESPYASPPFAPPVRRSGDPAIDDDLLAFIRTSIKSVWMLELLLFLRRHAERAWSPAELVRELRGSDVVVAQSLAGLQGAGLIVQEAADAYRYAPAGSHFELMAGRIDGAYAQTPNAVVKAILSAPNDKLQTFADAFKIRKD